ncbi:NosD domain-containing protein [Ningiella sp. W23]|uniref:NosD domain-containing protein n=1 Tax=Ningiella sp. W23 TaxID=3023715 RepID=UPI003758434B
MILSKFRNIITIMLLSLASASASANACNLSIYSDITLTGDLDCTSSSFVFGVFSDNVTIDLNGYTIRGSETTRGIRIRGYDGLTIKNGNLIGFSMAVNASDSHKLRISNINFVESGASIITTNSNHGFIEKNKFINVRGNAVSISVNLTGASANNNRILNNEFFQVGLHAVNLCGANAEKNLISDNYIWKNRASAIMLREAHFNQILGNKILESGNFPAIQFDASSYNEVDDNTLRNGQKIGIGLGKQGGACLATSHRGSLKNQIVGNRINGFPTSIAAGTSTSLLVDVEGSFISGNRFSASDTGVFFNRSTKHNRLRNNVFRAVDEDVVDLGVSNRW